MRPLGTLYRAFAPTQRRSEGLRALKLWSGATSPPAARCASALSTPLARARGLARRVLLCKREQLLLGNACLSAARAFASSKGARSVGCGKDSCTGGCAAAKCRLRGDARKLDIARRSSTPIDRRPFGASVPTQAFKLSSQCIGVARTPLPLFRKRTNLFLSLAARQVLRGAALLAIHCATSLRERPHSSFPRHIPHPFFISSPPMRAICAAVLVRSQRNAPSLSPQPPRPLANIRRARPIPAYARGHARGGGRAIALASWFPKT